MNHQHLKSIMMTYPGFQTLPRGIKKLLLVSESFFFREAATLRSMHPGNARHLPSPRGGPETWFFRGLPSFGGAWKN